MALPKTGRRALSAAAAALIGVVTTLVVATPASANVVVQNDGATACLDNGDYALPYHIESGEPFAIKLTSLTTTPAYPQLLDHLTGSVLESGETTIFWQFAPPGTTAASFTVTWEKVGEPAVTGSFTGNAIQSFPDCTPGVEAEVVANCDQTADVHLSNLTDRVLTFLVGGTEHVVPASSTETLDDVATTAGELAVDVLHEHFGVALPVTRFTWTRPSDCPPPTDPTTPPTTTTTTTTTTTGAVTTTTTTATSLPSTGSSLTGFVAAGVALVGLGIALLVILRVRRQRADAS